MNTVDGIGLRLSAVAPVYEFTRHSGVTTPISAVFLTIANGQPHWFATDGYSAMLTKALLPEHTDLFEVNAGRHAYQAEHIKTLFRYVRHKYVIYDETTGNLLSPDGIVIVPAYVYPTSEDKEPIMVEPPTNFEAVFGGELIEQGEFEFGWKFVSAVRSAFKANSKEALLTMTTLDGSRIHLDVQEPYQGRVLIALNRDAPPVMKNPAEEDEDA